MLVIKYDTTGLIADYSSRASEMLKLFSSSVSTAHSHPTRNIHLLLWDSMFYISVQMEVLRLKGTRVQRYKLHV